jgi:PadR family transcriptional regulator
MVRLGSVAGYRGQCVQNLGIVCKGTTKGMGLTTYIYICRVRMMNIPRISTQTLQVLELFVGRPSGWRYGYELSRETGLKSGTLYPILIRLSKHGLLETKWVTTEDGVPPRHTYRLTAKGLASAKARLAAGGANGKVRRAELKQSEA